MKKGSFGEKFFEIVNDLIASWPSNLVLGLGSGRTVDSFIELLAESGYKSLSIVAASSRTVETLQKFGFKNLVSLQDCKLLDLYVDSADRVGKDRILIKGGGAALTGEKIAACMAKKFICLVHSSKRSDDLISSFIPIEVIPMAVSHVRMEVEKFGARFELRQALRTDSGNLVFDLFELFIEAIDKGFEERLDLITGVVENGIFARNRPDEVIWFD